MRRFLVLLLCGCAFAQSPEYETNDPEAALSLNGAQATTSTPAVTTVCPLGPVTSVVSSQHVGLGWEAGISEAPIAPLSGAGIMTANGQTINLDLGAAVVWFFHGGSSADFNNPLPAAIQTFNFIAAPTVGDATLQVGVQSPTHPDGVALSQANQLSVAPSGFSAPFPQGDDVSMSVATGAGTCFAPIAFYGTSYTVVEINSNGRIMFGGASNDFSPTISEAMSGPGFFGFWTDMNVVLGGSIALDSPAAQQLRVSWTNVPYYGEPGTANSFELIIDTGTGQLAITGLAGIAPNPINNTTIPSNDTQFLGISMGSVGATDGGATTFVTGTGMGAQPSDMIYDWFDGAPGGAGLAPSLTGSLTAILFSPTAGTYSWQGF